MELLHKDLSYKIVGAVFNVYNSIGYGYKEKEYQKALAAEFDDQKVLYKREVYSNLKYKDKIVAGFYLDFLVEEKVILELKVANGVYKQHFNQVLEYLKNNNLDLGIIAAFSPNGVIIKRVANQNPRNSRD